MCMVQHMATTLIGGRARACGWNWKGQIKYSIFPKGANQRTPFLSIRARIDWFLYCNYAQTSCLGPIRTLGTHLKNVHGNGSEEFLEKINTTCTR